MFVFSLDKPPAATYVPPAPPEEEEAIFKSMEQGINFDKYDDIPVEVTGKLKKETLFFLWDFTSSSTSFVDNFEIFSLFCKIYVLTFVTRYF